MTDKKQEALDMIVLRFTFNNYAVYIPKQKKMHNSVEVRKNTLLIQKENEMSLQVRTSMGGRSLCQEGGRYQKIK